MRDEDDPGTGTMFSTKKEIPATLTFLCYKTLLYVQVLDLDVGATVCLECLKGNLDYCGRGWTLQLSSHSFVTIESVYMEGCVLRSQRNDFKTTRHNG